MFFTDVIQSDNPPSSSRAHRSMIHFPFSHFPPQARIQTQGTERDPYISFASQNKSHITRSRGDSSPFAAKSCFIFVWPLTSDTTHRHKPLLQKNTLTSNRAHISIQTLSVSSHITQNTKLQKHKNTKKMQEYKNTKIQPHKPLSSIFAPLTFN